MKALAKWSVDDYHCMIQAGILRDYHVELLAGEMVSTTAQLRKNSSKQQIL